MAMVAATPPSFVVLAIAAGYARIARAHWLTGAMRGVALAVVGIQFSVGWPILRQPGEDWRGFMIAAGEFGLFATRKVRLPIVLAAAAVVGYVIYL